jgi:hypothetical protein
MTAASLPPSLRAFAERTLGPLARVEETSQPFGEGRVWRLEPGEGPAAYLKQHRYQEHFLRELKAYLGWRALLADAMPELLAHEEPPHRLLLMTAAEGAPMETLRLSAAEEREAFRLAGELRRRLGEIPVTDDHDPLSLDRALLERVEGWCKRAIGLVADADIAWTRAAFSDGSLFSGCQRTACHRDFQPRNWVIDRCPGGLHLTIIDFGLARPDLWLNDLVRLEAGPWLRDPSLKVAFLEGCGRPLTETEQRQLDALLALHALGTVVWSAEHNDSAFEAEGRALLTRLRARSSA